jgi:diguanylate cyclase (GGDEF)-like protein/PAS domain S-box-containing protein
MVHQTSILIVEDERVIAFYLQHQLEALGYRATAVVASGEQAIEKAGQLRPDLVLMDIHLEGALDGIEAAGRIHADYRIPVVFLTAHAEDETLQRAQATLPFGYLVKPVEARELHATLQMALSRRTAEVSIEADIEKGTERLRLALDSAELGVWEWDTSTCQITTGGRIKGLLGGAPEPIGESWEAFLARVHPDDRAGVQEAMEEAVAFGRSLNLIFRTQQPGGEIGWIEAHAKAAQTTPPGAVRVVGIVKDITERREAEERLRQVAVVLETLAEAIFIMDREHRIVSVNPAFTAITGYPPEAVLGQDPDVLLHARRHTDQFYPRLETTGGGQWQGETYCRHKNGTVVPVWENVSVVRDEKGAVTHYVAVFSDISAIRRAETQLTHLAHYDALTGLPNRVLFNDRLDQTLARAQREEGRCAILFFDLDGFKVINDTLGHSSGDLLLQTVATRLKAGLRSHDTAARLGGDEFVVLLVQIAHPEDAARGARKLLEALATPVELGGERVTVSASVGLSVYPDNGRDRETLLKAADTAMYNAKAQGRNRYCFYTEELAARATERLSIEQGLRRALESEGLVLHYQPQVALRDGALTGVEALVRWRHPQEGIIMPGRFIGIAEESGIIEPLGRWVLFRACAQAADMLRAGAPPFQLSVNVSAQQLARDHFEDTVRAALAESTFPASRLELELTESTLQVIEHSRRLLDTLKALGVTIAIDDFGTGYSSLSIIKHLPIDRLKIDRSFVRDIPGDADDVAIVEAIVSLSRTLGFRVIAEGVETEAQLAVLRGLGCEEGQGYLFSRPLPLLELQSLSRGDARGRSLPWG